MADVERYNDEVGLTELWVDNGDGTYSLKMSSASTGGTVALTAGSAIIGKVGIDQTTPGTTNAVAPISGQAGVAGGSGTVSALTQHVVLATNVDLPPATVATASLANSSAYEASRVVKASAGKLIALFGYNSKTSAQFIQVHNTTTVPADTAVPVAVFSVPASSNFSCDVPVCGIPLGTGISVCNSSTAATKTLGSTDCWFTVVYI